MRILVVVRSAVMVLRLPAGGTFEVRHLEKSIPIFSDSPPN